MKKNLFFGNRGISLSILAALVTASFSEAASVNRTWNGGADGNWGTAANWTPSGSPATASPFDSVTFSGGARLATTNNLSTSITNLTFTAGGFTVNGNALFIRGGITNAAGVNTVNLPVTFANNPKNWDVAPGAEIDFVGGSITGTSTVNPPFEKFDAGNVRFKGTNLWALGADLAGGALIVDSGSLTITNDGFRLAAANGAWAGVIITNGGALTLGANSVGKNFNFRLGSTALLAGTNELDISSGQIFLGTSITQFIVGQQAGTYGVVNQTGGAILFQNGNAANNLLLANAAGATGIYNLSGGLLQVPAILGGAQGGGSYFNFNGGTLTPYSSVSANNFIQGLTAATVQNGGAIIDTTNINLTISQPLLNGGSGGLTKLGVGTLTLSGANTYIGSTVVSAGELIVSTLQTGGGAFQVADNTALGVTVAASGASLKTAALTLGGSAGATNEFFLGATGNPASPVIVATNLTVNGSIAVNLYGAGFSPGQFPLIKYSAASGVNAASFQLNLLPAGVSAYISNNVANTSIDLVITAAPVILWTGAANDSWDIGASANWYDFIGLQAVPYADGASVQFDDTATGGTSVSLAATVSPGGVIVTNNSATYSFNGPGVIAGAGALTKSGGGTLIVGTANTYTGNTVINAGTLQLGTAQAIPGGTGAGDVTVNGELDLAGNAETINGLNGSGVIDTSTGSGTLTLGANNDSGTFSGSINNTGGSLNLVKSGGGTQTLTANNTFSGGVTLAGGRLQVAGGNSLGGGPLSLQAPSTGVTLASYYAGPVALNNPVYVFGGANYPVNFDTTGGDIILNNSLTGTGPDIFKKGYNTLWIGTNGAGYSAGGLLQLYQGSFTVNGGAWTNLSNGIRFYAGGSDTVRLVVTNGGTVAVGYGGTGTYNIQLGYAGGLTGTNELDISSGQLIFGPSFRQIIAGNAVGTCGVVNQTGGTVLFQSVTNGNVGVLLGNNAGTTGWYYLNGGNLITPRVIGANGAGYFYLNGGTLTPTANLSANNFVSGLTAAYVGNGGAIFDTTNISVTVSQSLLNGGSGGLTKLGASTLTLTGTNTYTGATLVNAGELWLPTTQLGGGGISVADGAALGISLAAANPTLSTAALTLGNATGATLEFNFGAAGNPSAPLAYATNLTVNGNLPINVSGLQLTLGQFPLLKYRGASGLTSAALQLNNIVLAPGFVATLSNNVANSSIDLVVTVAPTLQWTGTAGSSWDIATTPNWLNQNTRQPSAYTNGFFARLDDSATGSTTVTLAATVAPAGIWVSNNVQTYTFNGSSGIGGSATFTKDGSGTVIVGTANTYTGNTVINAGTFVVSGSVGASAVTVSGGALAGSGSINGAVTINPNGSLILGGLDPVNTGTLTVNSNLNLAGTIFAKLNKALTQSNDAAIVTGALAVTNAATLVLSNVGPALAAGDRFQLFNKAVANGGSVTISPAAPGAGLSWQNRLATDGSVVVSLLVASNPTNLVSQVANGQLTLSWPADHIGWRLQAQTNGLGANWFDVAGANLTNFVSVPIDPANGSVFFRLVSP